MKTKSILPALAFCTLACHTQQRVAGDFVSVEGLIPGETNSIIAATDHAIVESQFIVEKRMTLQGGRLLILAHPSDKPEAASSIRVNLTERGSDDVAVTIEIQSSLYGSAEASRNAAKATLQKVQAALNK